MTKKTLFAALMIAAVLWLAGCQTVQGIGGDIKWMGEKGAQLLAGE